MRRQGKKNTLAEARMPSAIQQETAEESELRDR